MFDTVVTRKLSIRIVAGPVKSLEAQELLIAAA